jgi:hypothetical protein
MNNFKKFLTLGIGISSTALAMSLPMNAQAQTINADVVNHLVATTQVNEALPSQSTIASRFSVIDETLANPAYQSNPQLLAGAKMVASETAQTLMKVIQAGYVHQNELPDTFKVAIVNNMVNAEEGSHYKEDGNELKVSYYNTINKDGTPQVRNQLLGIMKEIPALENVQVNEKLLNQFVFLHELSHSVNHHHEGHTFDFNDPNTNLNAEELALFKTTINNTLDENFADTYGGIQFLKINNFSPESIDTLKAVATLRDHMSKQQNANFTNAPDTIEAHSSFYSLTNVLNNIDTLKKTTDVNDLRLLANEYSSNGTAMAYQNYREYHKQSFAATRINDVSEMMMVQAYNEVNAKNADFKPLPPQWDNIDVALEKPVTTYIKDKVDSLFSGQTLKENFSLNQFSKKDVTDAIAALRMQQGVDDENIARYTLVRGMYEQSYSKKHPEYMRDQAREVIKNDTTLNHQEQLLSSIDSKMTQGGEQTISAEVSVASLAKAHANDSTVMASNNSVTPRIPAIPDIQAFREKMGVAGVSNTNNNSMGLKKP